MMWPDKLGFIEIFFHPSTRDYGFYTHPSGVLMLPKGYLAKAKGHRPEGSIKTSKGWIESRIPSDGVEQ